MRQIGLHLRLTDTLHALAQKAIDLRMSVFQCFLLHQQTQKLIAPTAAHIRSFALLAEQFEQLFVHASYWTNLASIKNISMRAIEREMALSKRLGFTHMVVHPGTAKGAQSKQEGIDALVRRLNRLMKDEEDIQLVLENTAHGKMAIGSDIADFHAILQKLDRPDRVSFCIDTVHAHVYGYPLETADEQEQFFDQLDRMIGVERIALLHLNNTHQECGSLLDRHAMLDQGVLSLDALRRFSMHPHMANVPIIMELPHAPKALQQEQMHIVRSWHHT